MRGAFTHGVLQALLDAGHVPTAVLVDVPGQATLQRLEPQTAVSHLPLATPFLKDSAIQLAWRHGIPAYAAGRIGGDAARLIADLAPDVAAVACFGQRIPTAVLDLPPHGFLNVHPSLLPALRGPSPRFWALRLGLAQTGVTIHRMDAGLDTGPMAAQTPLALPDGSSGSAADALLAELGGRLLVGVLRDVAAGTAVFQPQPAGGSHFPRPAAADFALDPAWTARRAFNFMRGTADWRRPYPLTIAGRTLLLREALAFDATAVQAQPVHRSGQTLTIQFYSGVLTARA